MRRLAPLRTNRWLRLERAIWLLLTGLLAQHAAANTDEQWESTGNITAAARDFVVASITTAHDATTRVDIGRLDERLRLPVCTAPLVAFAPAGADISRGGTVGVRCPARPGWKIYVPVRIAVMARVLVAVRALARGDTLNAADFTIAERDVTRLPGGFLTDVGRLQGKTIRRRLMPGAVISQGMLLQAQAIRRGQRVTLVTGGSAVSIRMAGTAMANGGVGDRIAVKNLSSGRLVEGLVRTTELVEVMQN